MPDTFLQIASKIPEEKILQVLLAPVSRIIKIGVLTKKHQRLDKRHSLELLAMFIGFILGIVLPSAISAYKNFINHLIPFTTDNFSTFIITIWGSMYSLSLLTQISCNLYILKTYHDFEYFLSNSRKTELTNQLRKKIQLRPNEDCREAITNVFLHMRSLKRGTNASRHPSHVNLDTALENFMYADPDAVLEVFKIFYGYYLAHLLAQNHEQITQDQENMKKIAHDFSSPGLLKVTPNKVVEVFIHLSRRMRNPNDVEATMTALKMLSPDSEADRLEAFVGFVLNQVRVSDEGEAFKSIAQQYGRYMLVLERLKIQAGDSESHITESPRPSGRLEEKASDHSLDAQEASALVDIEASELPRVKEILDFLDVTHTEPANMSQEQIDNFLDVIGKRKRNSTLTAEQLPPIIDEEILRNLAARTPSQVIQTVRKTPATTSRTIRTLAPLPENNYQSSSPNAFRRPLPIDTRVQKHGDSNSTDGEPSSAPMGAKAITAHYDRAKLQGQLADLRSGLNQTATAFGYNPIDKDDKSQSATDRARKQEEFLEFQRSFKMRKHRTAPPKASTPATQPAQEPKSVLKPS